MFPVFYLPVSEQICTLAHIMEKKGKVSTRKNLKIGANEMDFINQYTKETGCTAQHFIEVAIKEKITNLKTEQYLKDK